MARELQTGGSNSSALSGASWELCEPDVGLQWLRAGEQRAGRRLLPPPAAAGEQRQKPDEDRRPAPSLRPRFASMAAAAVGDPAVRRSADGLQAVPAASVEGAHSGLAELGMISVPANHDSYEQVRRLLRCRRLPPSPHPANSSHRTLLRSRRGSKAIRMGRAAAAAAGAGARGLGGGGGDGAHAARAAAPHRARHARRVLPKPRRGVARCVPVDFWATTGRGGQVWP